MLRVAQWTTGNVAREAVKAMLLRSDMELVGAYAHSPEKVGVDVGRLCGLAENIGVWATDDVDSLLNLDLDCVVYTPLHLDVPEVTRILRAGVNVVTSAEFLTGLNLSSADRSVVQAATRDGDATFFGSGVNPGFMQMMAAVSSGMSTGVQRASITESVDVSQFIGDANFAAVGWGRPKGDPGHAEDVRKATKVFAEAVDVLAKIMRVNLDKITCSVDFACATEDLIADGVSIPAGHVAGMDVKWHGTVDAREILSINQRWVATQSLDPAWTVDHGYHFEIVGDPHIHVRIDMLPTDEDLANLTRDRMRSIGLRITAAPLINAIPAVCAAPAGILTYADLPIIAAPLSS